MHVLIVESETRLGDLWKAHLERNGCCVTLVSAEEAAIVELRRRSVSVIVMNVVLAEGSALSVADYASYRQPQAKIVFVTSDRFFSDGSIFQLAPNACAFLRSETPVDDLTAVVEHYANRD